jgi:superfamily II DNA/RNA helicase
VLFDAASAAPAPDAGVSFAALGVPQSLIAALTGLGAERPFPIQAATLQATLAGRDVLGRGRTGSGKTIAFAIPLVARLSGHRATRADGQRMLFSATLDDAISVLVKDFLVDPAVHAVDDESSPVASMTHRVLLVQPTDRGAVVRQLANGDGRRLLFARTKHGARKWAQTLTKNGIPAVDLHGNLSQGARERNLAAFSSGAAKVLVATDIAARGIHVDDIELVVHIDPPAEHKAYLHRSGRTARAGSGGTVVTIMLPEQRDDVRALMRKARIDPAITTVTAGTDCLATVLAD